MKRQVGEAGQKDMVFRGAGGHAPTRERPDHFFTDQANIGYLEYFNVLERERCKALHTPQAVDELIRIDVYELEAKRAQRCASR